MQFFRTALTCKQTIASPLNKDHLYVKVDESESSKVWICLYTCCITRTVHLELVPDMSAQTFLRSFKRFTARREIPVQIISDNRKTFASTAQIIKNMLKTPEIQQQLAGLKVKWVFNLEKAPWWGGFFERMIQSMKRCLKKTIGKAKLTYDELLIVLTKWKPSSIPDHFPMCLVRI